MHNACWKGHSELVKLLLENKANPNLTNDHGETCLHWACRMGHTHLIKPLLLAGANQNSLGMEGTPFDVSPKDAKIREEIQRKKILSLYI